MIAALLLASALVGPPAPSACPPRRDCLDCLDAEAQDRAVLHGVIVNVFRVSGSAMFDIWGTKFCEDHNPRCREGNPLGLSHEARTALKGATGVLLVYALYVDDKHGHHNRAKWAGRAYMAVELFLGANAVRIGMQK